ncbi:MAG: alpha/beta hydrolase [Caulobacter sp. 12-67-6]|nr:MAG: alpha/beta hydrolase [Caulobacter sp. 12-67-6]OYX69207.1 MAG: alpha/beta hydrolase [Caulobacter sp. 32-67-35]
MKTLVGGLLTAVMLIVVLAAVGWLALQRKDIPYDSLEAKYDSPASQYMDLGGGVRVHYRDEGRREGPTLVLVHGYSASLHAWEPWVRSLSSDYRVISLDLPGHGLTRSDQGYPAGRQGYGAVVDQVTRKLGVERFTLAGNSMGGGVAWEYAVDHPDRVEGLVLVDAAGWPRDGGGSVLIFEVLRHPWGRAVLKNVDTRPLVRQGLQSAYLDDALVTPELVDRYVELARAPGHRDILLGLQTGPRREATPQVLSKIKAPTLVMFGQKDTVIPATDGDRFAAAIPGSTLIVYPDVGHVPMEQIPDRSVQDLKTWLKAKVYAAVP